MDPVNIDEAQVRRMLQERMSDAVDAGLDAAADYWAEHARIDTGLMRMTTERQFEEVGAWGVSGQLTFTADQGRGRYSGYQEYGTRYIRGMHLTSDMVDAAQRAFIEEFER